MIVAEAPFAAIDFESAGVRRGSTEVPVQIGIAQMRGGRMEERLCSFLSTEEPITWSAQKVHGIRAEDLSGAPTLLSLWPQIKGLLEGRWVVAHGAATEKRFLRAFPFHSFGPWVDTLKLARAVWPTQPSFALGDLLVSLGIEPALREHHAAFRWHDALSDSLASLLLLKRIIEDTGIAEEPVDILLRADDSHYHRLKAR